MSLHEKRLAVLGCGTMGEAILGGLLAANRLEPSSIIGIVRREQRAVELEAKYAIQCTLNAEQAIGRSDIVLLCLKPQNARPIIEELKTALSDKLLISICAGVTLTDLHAGSPASRIIRAMPNTPSVIREGMSVIAPHNNCTAQDIQLANDIFSAVGKCRILDEKHLNAVTGLSGSGPAFACVVLEALADGGVMMGLPRDVAVELAAQTMQGAARLVLQSGQHPASLKDEVTTPAGCTIAGLLMMEDGKIRSTLARTIQEATKVAAGLGQKD